MEKGSGKDLSITGLASHNSDSRNNLLYLFPFLNSCSKNFVASLAPLSYFFSSSSAEITSTKNVDAPELILNGDKRETTEEPRTRMHKSSLT